MYERRQTRDNRNYFCICANGESFDVDAYAKTSTLAIHSISHRGDPIPGSDAHKPLSGLQIDLGDGLALDVHEQQEIAAAFLSEHADELKRLRAVPQVTTFYLGLQQTVQLNSLGSIMDFSEPLMKASLAIGIGVTIWCCLSEPDSRDLSVRC
jgi:hypothetical protein